MAKSKCSSCGNEGFELVEAEPQNAKYVLVFVQCAACGAVVGALDYENLGTLIAKIARRLGIQT